jgi:hypothetical protein
MLDGSFERDSLDIFHIGNPASYIGDIMKIGLERNDNESNPDFYIDDIYGYVDLSGINPTADWNVGDVLVENMVTGSKWTFTINQELTDNSEHVYWPDAGE